MEERALITFIKSYGKYIVTLLLFIVVGYVLLYLTYKNVKQEMIEGLNARQLIHAKQAARGIEAFFGDHINILQNFSKNEHIVTLDESGKRLMRELISSHVGEISIISREDSHGRILHAEPYDRRVIGQPVTQMEDFLKVKSTHQIAVSDVFTNRRGFKSIIIHVPVFKRGSFDGTFAMLISFDFIAKRYIEDIRIGKNGYAWVVSRDGTELSCPIPGHVGNSVFDNCREFPDILAMAGRMIQGEQGVTTYMFDRIRGGAAGKTTKHAVFMPIRLGDNFWSIVVATPEEEVISAFSGFRDRLLLIAIFFIIIIGFFLYLLIKTRIVVKEAERIQKTEKALRESEEKYRNLFENANESIFVAQDGKLVFVNPVTVMMIGYSPEDLVAKPFIEFIHPDDRDMVINRHVRRMKGEEIPQIYSFRIIRKDGSIRRVELNTVLINWMGKPATLNFLSDITEKVRAEEDSRRLASVVRHSLELVNLAKPNGTMVFLNDAGKKMLGISEEDIAQTNIMKVIPEHLRDKVQLEVLPSINKDGYWEGDLQYLNVKTGGLTDVHAITFKIADPETGTLQLLANVSQDITERKRAEESLRGTLNSLRKAVGTTIQVMVSAVETRDPYTAGHQIRSADLARAIAIEMGLPQEKIDGIRMAGSIHDIGKLSIPAEILSKPKKLTEIEFSLIKEHSRSGYEMLKDVESPWPLAEIVYQHHERMDGSGYPRNLKGDDILMEARIMAVSDVVESMASHRPYRPAIGIKAALEEIEKNKGILYDNTVAEACLKLFREKGFQLEGA
jgi:PAS domain S-box-containing protein